MKFDELYQKICNDISNSIDNFQKGEDIDLKPIDDDVKKYCGEIGKLSHNESIKYDKKIKSIINHFNTLIFKLEEQKNIVSEQIKDSVKLSKAQNAYGKAIISGSESNSDK